MSTKVQKASRVATVLGEDGVSRPAWAAADPLLRRYYDEEWGRPVRDEQGMFERLSLEVFQAGLSWATVLRKRPAFREAFMGFDPDVVAGFTDADIARLLEDARIIRNRAKIAATAGNARATVRLRERGGLADLVWSYRPAPTNEDAAGAPHPSWSPESAALARALKQEGFKFVGPVSVFALMQATGVAPAAFEGSDADSPCREVGDARQRETWPGATPRAV